MESRSNDGDLILGENEEYIDYILSCAKAFQDDLEGIGLRIKEHEDSLYWKVKLKKTLDEVILDYKVKLGKCSTKQDTQLNNDMEAVKRNIIANHGNSASAFFLGMNPELHDSIIGSVVGIVALLGNLEDGNLNRVLSNFIGVETMLAIVCTSQKHVDVLEALLGLASEGRFSAIFLDSIRKYEGKVVYDNGEKRLDLIKPKLPNGEFPNGFLGFAVNMIKIKDETQPSVGLRESLFYALLSHLQVYETEEHMLNALPFINDGAVSLDGSVVNSSGICSPLNDVHEQDYGIQFPFPCKAVDMNITATQLKGFQNMLKIVLEDIYSEDELLRAAKDIFQEKKLIFLEFIASVSLLLQIK